MPADNLILIVVGFGSGLRLKNLLSEYMENK